MMTPDSTDDGQRSGANDRVRQPMVSIIVPVLNAAPIIGQLLDALSNQTYEQESYEIIVVDNGSTDNTKEVVEAFPVILLEESRWRSPYAARNAGIARASGQVYAFTDADCTPETTWLECGVDVIERGGIDLIGGKVNFTFSKQVTLAELADALWHLDVKRQIEHNRACMTANLFVWSEVFDLIGPFDPNVRSGGDGRWTRRATDRGFRLEYAADAIVSKPARKLGQLLAKSYRIGRGLPAAWVERGLGRGGVAGGVVRLLIPPSPSMIRRRIRDRGYDWMAGRLTGIWCVAWLLESVRAVGCLRGWLEIRKQRGGEPAMVQESDG